MEPIAPELLEILVCPETHQPVEVAPADLAERLSARQSQGELKNRTGQAVKDPFDGLLVRQDGLYAYPIVDGIPVMLIDEAIPLDQVPVSG